MEDGPVMTIDDLARSAGLTVRNVRNYQTKGLIPAPELRGRKGIYSNEHLVRLQLIKEMQAAGFNLTAIKQLLDRVPHGAGEEALRFERTLLSPWSDEAPEILDADELAERFGNPPPELFERAERAGVVRVLDDGRVELPVPSLVRAGQQVLELGVPIDDVMTVMEQLVANSNRVAGVFVDLFVRNIWNPFEAAGRPSDQWPEVRAALERLRPIASQAVVAAFQARMASAVEEAFGTALTPEHETA